jgi:phosphate transport system protein
MTGSQTPAMMDSQTERNARPTEELREDVLHMGDLVTDAVAKANRALLHGDRAAGDQVIAGDDVIDRMELAIARKCIDVITAGEARGSEEQREVAAILKVITELERIADLAEEVALIARKLSPPHPAGIAQRLRKTAELASEMVQVGLHAFASRDLSRLHRLREQEEVVDVAQRWLNAEVQRHLKAEPGQVQVGIGLLFASHDLGRMADHATNIGEWAIYSATGGLGRLKSYRPSDYSASLLPLV